MSSGGIYHRMCESEVLIRMDSWSLAYFKALSSYIYVILTALVKLKKNNAFLTTLPISETDKKSPDLKPKTSLNNIFFSHFV
jgi:hypothetical protein